MFERFTRASRRAVRTAVEEAERRGDPRISTEHLLIGVLAGQLPFDRSLLGPLDRPLPDLRALLVELDAHALATVGIDPILAEAPPPPARRRHRPFTARAKAALEGCLRTAVARGERRLGPEHLFVALLDTDPSDPVARTLAQLGLDPVELRTAILASLARAS